MDSRDLAKKMRAASIDLMGAETLEAKQFAFDMALRIVIPAKNQPDRTSFRRISNWLVDCCNRGQFQEDIIFRRVLDFALEASGLGSRKQAAVELSVNMPRFRSRDECFIHLEKLDIDDLLLLSVYFETNASKLEDSIIGWQKYNKCNMREMAEKVVPRKKKKKRKV